MKTTRNCCLKLFILLVKFSIYLNRCVFVMRYFFSHCDFIVFSAEEESEDSHVFLVPTLECMYVLGQFGQEMYPGESWPRAEELTSKN